MANRIEQHGSNTKIFTLVELRNTTEVHIRCATTLRQTLVTFMTITATVNEDIKFSVFVLS